MCSTPNSIPMFSFFFFNDTATTEIYTLSLHDALPISQAVQRHAAGAALTGDELNHVARLLGLYTRLTQEQAVLASIERMVALPTVRDPKVPPHESPAILAFGELVQQMAKDFGLQYRNVDN